MTKSATPSTTRLTDSYTGESLLPTPEQRAKLEALLDRQSKLAEELDHVGREIADEAPAGFAPGTKDGVCGCGSPIIGYVPRAFDREKGEPEVWAVHTATLKNPSHCCSLDTYDNEEDATEAAWKMAQAKKLLWQLPDLVVDVLDPKTKRRDLRVRMSTLRENNADDPEILAALDKLEAGEVREVNVGGGAAARFTLKLADDTKGEGQ